MGQTRRPFFFVAFRFCAASFRDFFSAFFLLRKNIYISHVLSRSPVVCRLVFLQEVEKARESQESIIRELRAKSEADRAAHAEDVERIKVQQ